MQIVHLQNPIIPVLPKVSAKEERHMRCVAMIAKQYAIDERKSKEKFRLLKLQGKYPFDKKK